MSLPKAEKQHLPVLLATCVELLAPALQEPGSVVVDATLGMGGHTEALLRAAPNARVIGIDRDTQALEMARERLAPFGDRFTPVHATYDEILEVLDDQGIAQVQGILMDLGVSSWQLDQVERGFSYSTDAPLDMRMNTTAGPSAADLLNYESESELARIFKQYGEERYAGRIARSIVNTRNEQPLSTTGQLVEVILNALPSAARYAPGGHPAKRVFQAVRIAVNDELGGLTRALPAAVEALAVGGRLVVESYHSLEDRLVKQEFARGLKISAPQGLPVVTEQYQPYLAELVRGALLADDEELARNSRAASVRLRAVTRLRPTPDHLIRTDLT